MSVVYYHSFRTPAIFVGAWLTVYEITHEQDNLQNHHQGTGYIGYHNQYLVRQAAGFSIPVQQEADDASPANGRYAPESEPDKGQYAAASDVVQPSDLNGKKQHGRQ